MTRGKSNVHTVKIELELKLTTAELEVLDRLTGYGAQTNNEVCDEILTRHLRYHARERRRAMFDDEPSLIPRPIPTDDDEGERGHA